MAMTAPHINLKMHPLVSVASGHLSPSSTWALEGRSEATSGRRRALIQVPRRRRLGGACSWKGLVQPGRSAREIGHGLSYKGPSISF